MAQLNAATCQLTETSDGLNITPRRLIATQEPLFAALHRLKMTNHRSNVAINRPDVVFKGHFVSIKGRGENSAERPDNIPAGGTTNEMALRLARMPAVVVPATVISFTRRYP